MSVGDSPNSQINALGNVSKGNLDNAFIWRENLMRHFLKPLHGVFSKADKLQNEIEKYVVGKT